MAPYSYSIALRPENLDNRIKFATAFIKIERKAEQYFRNKYKNSTYSKSNNDSKTKTRTPGTNVVMPNDDGEDFREQDFEGSVVEPAAPAGNGSANDSNPGNQ